MSVQAELRASVVALLSEDAQQQAVDASRVTAAWAGFLEAVKGLPVEPVLTIGPSEQGPVRRRRGRPRLHVAEPPSAA